ncbi:MULTISPECIES: metal-sensitive transcriptional regulator [Streptococcus]|uniref:Metal-sensitive transcriptional regulator n=1 Tax=Streptococcus suis TaxID=1307 RepID=A0A116PH85_STRSU|nr:metal-sensitive transcriptional regulator [Streptococcus suis]MBO3838084.1 metal-sensitive transcriptional regulator [Streptococcus suis]MBO4114552.1 metal-sensitive transcriptional regulator [Streptococcus suis]MCK4074570.1 metal-sensitive transcriptional regulator [Streptococcus suis]MCL4921636.1 metal-sensitive transcriptional regulator [Streptococcus suis]MDD7566395.1 metal-sensitive transcriptional regulator [Streptococcus suis]
MNTEKKKMINRLKRAEGQLRGIQKMIEEEQECIDIVMQLSAVRSSINSMMGMVIAQKVQDCIEHPSDNPEEQEARLAEAINLIIKK